MHSMVDKLKLKSETIVNSQTNPNQAQIETKHWATRQIPITWFNGLASSLQLRLQLSYKPINYLSGVVNEQ
jgi:hypothetical protein